MSRVIYENPAGAAPAQGLYSHAARVSAGDLLFVAGQLAVAADGSVVGKNDFGAQFHRVFENLGDVLDGLGAGWNDIAKFTTYMVHSQDLQQFMSLRAEFFPKLFGKSRPVSPGTYSTLPINLRVREQRTFVAFA